MKGWFAKKPKEVDSFFCSVPGQYSFAAGNDFTITAGSVSTLTITGEDGKEILTIESNGQIVYHRPEYADEAARIFVRDITLGFEIQAGIRHARTQWEQDIKQELQTAADSGEVTSEIVDSIFKKHEMIVRLKGDAINS